MLKTQDLQASNGDIGVHLEWMAELNHTATGQNDQSLGTLNEDMDMLPHLQSSRFVGDVRPSDWATFTNFSRHLQILLDIVANFFQ